MHIRARGFRVAPLLAVAFIPIAPLRPVATTADCAGLHNHLLFILFWPYPHPMQLPNPPERGTQASVHEEFLSSGRPEDRKKFEPHFLPPCRERGRQGRRHNINAPWEGIATIGPSWRCLALEALSRSEVVSVSWDTHPREPVEGVLWATSMLELAADWADFRAEGKMSPVLGCQSVMAPACVASRPCGVSGVRGGSTCGLSTLWRSEVAVLAVRHCSHLVVAWLTPLLPSARGSPSRELDVGRVAEAAVAPCVVNSSESECYPWVATRPSGSLAGVREVGSLQWYQSEESTEIFKEVITIAFPKKGVRLPCKFCVRAAVCCSCCCVACVACVVARHVHAVVARLVVDSLAVVFPYGGQLQGSPGVVLLVIFGASLPHLPVVVVGLVLIGCELWLRCIAWLPCVLSGALVVLVDILPGPACVASAVLLAAVFSLMVGSSQECFVFVSGHRCVAPVVRDELSLLPVGLSMLQSAWALSVKGAGGLLRFLASCVLTQMVVWAGASVAGCALSGLRSFASGL
ncbi:hypothetical protein Taro_019202, partial [Colocasia esculenta]|nr:hypothetical protein [Colocasia esculenta]